MLYLGHCIIEPYQPTATVKAHRWANVGSDHSPRPSVGVSLVLGNLQDQRPGKNWYRYAMTKTLSLSTFGAFLARHGTRPLPGLSGGKMTALLVYLAIKAGHKHRREALAELFWPDLPAEAARFNLRHTFFHLRQSLGGDTGTRPFLLANREWLCFNPDSPYRMDTVEFAATVPACVETPYPQYCDPCIAKMEYMAGLYRGEFMAELSLPDCPDFEDWLQMQRESMRRHAITLLGRLSDCHEQAKAYTRALPFTLRYVELEPWNEEAHRRAIRLFALNGQNGAAIAQYDACCRALKKELGILPGEKTRSLADRIRKGEFQPDRAYAKGKPPVSSVPPLSAERHHVTVLYCELSPRTGNPSRALSLLQTPQKCCTGIIQRFSGHIVQAHGGGLLAYFGYPVSDESAARQAVQAALACAAEATPSLEVRAGVHTGLIVAGTAAGIPDTIGLTSGLAIRLRLAVKSGEVALSADTYRLVAKHFGCRSLGEGQLRDIPYPLKVYRVKGERAAGKGADNFRMGKPFGALFADSNRIARQIAEDMAPRVAADPRYQEARKNVPDAMRAELGAALTRIADLLLKDDAEFCKQLAENESFRQFVVDMIVRLEGAEKSPRE